MDELVLASVPLSQMGSAANDFVAAHRAVMAMFPHVQAEAARSAAGVLFRVERSLARVLIQSTLAPDRDLVAGAGGQVRSAPLRMWPAGTEFRYRIDMAASIREARSRRHRRLTTSEIPEWWAAAASRAGFELAGDAASHLEELHDVRSRSGAHRGLAVIRVASLAGGGVVVDPEAFLRARVAGMGRSKSYGCGLLSAVRV